MSDAICNARVVFDSPPSTIDDVHVVLDDFWAKLPELSLTDRFSFETAVIELTANVILHADDGRGLSCELEIIFTGDSLIANLHDTGKPGGIYLASPGMPDASAESGRGLPIIHALVNDVTYVRVDGSNRWHLMRKLGENSAVVSEPGSGSESLNG
ncbi:MAG: ATP-binding protein [Microbacteriaceae bacterium]